MSVSSLRAGLQNLSQLDEVLTDEDLNARLTAIDIRLQGLEITQQRQAQDPRLALLATIQQQRLQQDLRRLAYDVLGYRGLVRVNVGENEPLPAMLAGLPPQLIRLAQDYVTPPSGDAVSDSINREQSTYTQLVRLLFTDDSMPKKSNRDLP
jgi:hypothetical protein